MPTTNQLNNLRAAAAHAVDCEKATGVPCELILPQWVLESGWGQHSPGNNCFGIKVYPGCHGQQLLTTYEYFTERQLAEWLNHMEGRTAELSTGTFHDKRRYKVKDWFATFASLADCFKKRAMLFTRSPYLPYLQQYNKDHQLFNFVKGICDIYSTDPNDHNVIMQIASMPEMIATIAEARQ
jgi:flagellum-specific peptidoglycan hydrolase FlgJ